MSDLTTLLNRVADLESRLSRLEPCVDDEEQCKFCGTIDCVSPECTAQFYEEQKEEAEERRSEYATDCMCGAWQFTKAGRVAHVADCICGNAL